jgi:origin recognition complex subunit 3
MVIARNSNSSRLWRERLPITLIFGIATSLEIFQERLPMSSLRHLKGKHFDVVQRQELLEEIFLATITGSGISFRVGPSLVNAIMGRQRDHIQTIDDFIDSLQVIFSSSSNRVAYFLTSMHICATFTQIP